MSAIRHGISANEIIAAPDLRIVRDEEGKWTGSRSFTIRKEDKDSPTIQTAFAKGASLASISPDLGAYWNFLQISSFEFEDRPGGFCTVYATADGYSETGDFDFDREKTYTLRGVLTERPIIEHPNYLAEVRDNGSTAEHQAIVALYNNTGFVAGDPTATNPQVRQVADQSIIISSMTDADSLKWYAKIFKDGVRTYLAPQFEWTIEEANQGGLTSTQTQKFGKKETPPGSPPSPTGVTGWWHYVDLGDTRNSNSSSNSRTWRFTEGTADADLYDY